MFFGEILYSPRVVHFPCRPCIICRRTWNLHSANCGHPILPPAVAVIGQSPQVMGGPGIDFLNGLHEGLSIGLSECLINRLVFF